MTLRLYNTLTRCKELFEPLEPGQVQMYCCGVTVYDYCHLGHARSYLVWDMVRRYLQWRGYRVHYVQNFTDIDDKILRRAQAESSSMQTVSERYIAAYHEDMARLNILPADAYPQATGVMPEIIALIQSLIDQGYAYAVDGDVYYAVDRFPSYGKLSGRQLEQMEAGASGRVDEAEPKKRHPLDFALWKTAKPEEIGVYEPWDSPWGKGRPGWHIECSAMVQQAFGNSIDIHAGGMDLVFPHHENEIAQSEAATQKHLARYWLHNGFVNIQGEKMSKSLNNFKTIRDFLQDYPPMVLRLFVLQAHYRKPIDLTTEAITSAQNSWKTLDDALVAGLQLNQSYGWKTDDLDNRALLDTQAIERFEAAMDDNFNSPIALAVLFELAKELILGSNIMVHEHITDESRVLNSQRLEPKWRTFINLLQVLGLGTPSTASRKNEDLSADSPGLVKDRISDLEIAALCQQRQAARQRKNWAESDRIRDHLKAQGIALIDTKDGETRWHCL
ncbi:cysteinyl-tRNA synthetase [Neosynechococcus sphagnicola sy1]|uniref:Cysteine--tRNA ligase n=1 Tax=Neosynechococcus sphagnicola sy1 TaxID=1497020 RepID=A0A098TG67_9CYAN|nr:cysteine--tRNA ligase [Neosynechococcus sphagnicola]KGF71540.1 cysteinyl-tRNA synthetase [Neosynechococcus sphagnicola sy1]